MEEFINTLYLIEKYYFFDDNNNIIDTNALDEYEEMINTQLDILDKYKPYLPEDVVEIFEILINQGDNQLLMFYQQEMESDDVQGIDKFLRQILNYSSEKSKGIFLVKKIG